MDFSKICILDGYIDEPSLLGVPPYLSPYPRNIFGALVDALGGSGPNYVTIDQYRTDAGKKDIADSSTLLIIISGCLVPGRYLGGTPISRREIWELIGGTPRENRAVFLAGSPGQTGSEGAGRVLSSTGADEAAVFDIASAGEFAPRQPSGAERRRWAALGAQVVKQHPGFPQRIICELETYRGCVRYISGGCVFCSEPAHGRPVFRSPEDLADEAGALFDAGVSKFRIGGQSCIFSYGTGEVGSCETPRPNPAAVEKLFSGIRERCPGLEVLHVDNANPAVIAEHPLESERIAQVLVAHCTPGNVVAFGLESADPAVYEAANLNATPGQTLEAVEIVNRIGSERGANGMPRLLPGINLLYGLPGETKKTYDANREFLQEILDRGLLVRRTNIRQVARKQGEGPYTKVDKRRFIKFKQWVKEGFDSVMLQRMIPRGTVLRDIYIEKHDGNNSFGRQIGSYPLLAGFSFRLPLEKVDGMVVDYGGRSITCLRHPLPVNEAKLRELQAVPGIGKKRAASIVRHRPYRDFEDMAEKVELAHEIFDYKGLFEFG